MSEGTPYPVVQDRLYSSAGSPASSLEGDLNQAQTYLNWWCGPALDDPHLGDRSLVLAKIHGRGNISFEGFGNPSEAARWAVEKCTQANVYTHIALHSPDRPKGKGAIETALCLPGLAADLDAKSAFRGSNEGKAPDVASLQLVIADFEEHYGFPLMRIGSGFGIHASVRFREPLYLGDKAARHEADNLLARFAEGFRVFARQRGWPNTIDRVSLAGLIRVPGTLNRKGVPPLPVRVIDGRISR